MRSSTKTILLAVIFAVAMLFLPACGDGVTAAPKHEDVAMAGLLEDVSHCPVCLETDVEQVSEKQVRESKGWIDREPPVRRKYWGTGHQRTFFLELPVRDPTRWTNYRCVNGPPFRMECDFTPICVVYLGWKITDS